MNRKNRHINYVIGQQRSFMTLVVVLCSWMTLLAQQLTEQEAMERALQYMNGQASAKARRMAASSNGGVMKLKATPVEADRIYAFNMEGGGYVIASADSRTLPVLGYSTTGSIDWNHMPDNMRSWLKHYDDAITTLGSSRDFKDGEQIVTSDGQGSTTARHLHRAERVAIEPLIKTHWYQDEPYWNDTPKYEGADPSLQGKQCSTGCAATVMAQVMNYWQWPKTVPDGLPAYDYDESYNGITRTWHIDALPPTWFDWDNMANDYYNYDPEIGNVVRLETTEAQDKAVAKLMRYCGQTVETRYGTEASSAKNENVPLAFVNYLDYKAVQRITRFHFSIDEWEDIIYGELAAGRPIIYVGISDEGGHGFVCDGYDAGGLFHINWGWSGYCDGYFSLSVLNPFNNTSVGSGSSGIGYCIYEEAIIYTDPHMDPQPRPYDDSGYKFYQYQAYDVLDDNVVVLHYILYADYDMAADHALGTIDDDGQLHPLFMHDPNDSIVGALCYNTFYIKIDSTAFTPGQTMTLYPMVHFRHQGEEWQIVPPLGQNLTVGYDDEGQFFIQSNQSNPEPADMQMTDIAITGGTARLGERSDVTVCIRNNDASDYSWPLYLTPIYLGHIKPEEMDSAPVLAVGKEMTCGAYVPAGGEADVTFCFVPEYGGTVVFHVYDYSKQYFGELPLELNNDTLVNYDAYLENKSYLSHDGDQWYWNVELADRIGVEMPHWIPSDNLYLNVRQYIGDDVVKDIDENTGLNEYLAALPDNIGTGNYTFTYQMPVEVGTQGEYYFDSCLAEIANEELVSYSCFTEYDFTIDDPTDIVEIDDSAIDADMWYDLSGRKLEGEPTEKGVYMHQGKKVLVK